VFSDNIALFQSITKGQPIVLSGKPGNPTAIVQS